MVEFIDEAGDFHFEATAVLESVLSGKLTGLVAHPVFTELFYVASRLYEKLGTKNGLLPESKAGALLKWMFNSPNIVVPDNNLDLALAAGRIKQKFALALPDCYVLASAKLNECKAVFKSIESEMNKGDKLHKIKKDEKVELIFLDDYS